MAIEENCFVTGEQISDDKKSNSENLQSVVLGKESEHVFTFLKEVDLHVTQSFLQLSNLILPLL